MRQASEAADMDEQKRLAGRLHHSAMLVEDMGWLDAAMATFERALAMKEKAYGPEYPDVASTLTTVYKRMSASGPGRRMVRPSTAKPCSCTATAACAKSST